ncbi:MAG: WYL domain-containing protein, partial [Bacteroidota bacterium]
MSEPKPRLARLTAILTQLQAQQLVTARFLAEKHGVSIRTIYRDIRTLEQSGVPILTEEGRGYSLLAGYQLPPIMFTEEEANALITAEKLIRQNKDQSLVDYYTQAITKIKSVLRGTQKTQTELLASRLQVRNNPSQERSSDYLIQLQSAISRYEVLHLEYLSLAEHPSKRHIEPFALYTTQGNWILVAFCQLKQDFRAFRLDRIQGLQATGTRFEPHPLTLEAYLEQCRRNWLNTPDIPLSPTTSTFVVHQKLPRMQKEQIAPFLFAGIGVRTSNQAGKAAQDIGALWQRFLGEQIATKIPNVIDPTVLTVYTDYDGDHNQPYTALIGCRVSSL